MTIALMRAHSVGEPSGWSGCSRVNRQSDHLQPARIPSLSTPYLSGRVPGVRELRSNCAVIAQELRGAVRRRVLVD